MNTKTDRAGSVRTVSDPILRTFGPAMVQSDLLIIVLLSELINVVV